MTALIHIAFVSGEAADIPVDLPCLTLGTAFSFLQNEPELQGFTLAEIKEISIKPVFEKKRRIKRATRKRLLTNL